MVRRVPLLLAAALAVATLALRSPAVQPVRGVTLEADEAAAEPVALDAHGTVVAATAPEPAATGSEIVPGSVNRSSPFLDATYDTYLRLGWSSRKVYVDS